MWQVLADSKQQNGSFKVALSQIKSEILKQRLNKEIDELNRLPTDLILCINYAWGRSFALIEPNKKIFADVGWGHLNYNLLCRHDLKATIIKFECQELHLLME